MSIIENLTLTHFIFTLAETLSSALASVLIPGVKWFYQTKSQGIVICTYLSSLAILSLNFILPITSLT